MTELETIQRAKMHMDKLTKDINAIDDTVIHTSKKLLM